MNNLSVSWNYTKFNSKEEARKYCLSNECKNNIDYLYGLAHSLREQGQTEPLVSHGHGYPMESDSSMEASYVSNEANRLQDLRDYFSGVLAKPGYKWEYSTHGLHSVFQPIDLDNATIDHPVFLEYMKSNNLSKDRIKEVFNFWLDANLNPNMDNMFKLAYKFKLENLIPDNLVLFDLVIKPIKKTRRK